MPVHSCVLALDGFQSDTGAAGEAEAAEGATRSVAWPGDVQFVFVVAAADDPRLGED
ncbi:MAG TPA: hypothetical protein VJT16_04900 [Streptosporangiaceae bacterium]|nr:hypothetical protein [Streptosporangiaceae bacterium]